MKSSLTTHWTTNPRVHTTPRRPLLPSREERRPARALAGLGAMILALLLAACTQLPEAEQPKVSCPLPSDQVEQLSPEQIEQLCKRAPEPERKDDPSVWFGGFG